MCEFLKKKIKIEKYIVLKLLTVTKLAGITALHVNFSITEAIKCTKIKKTLYL